MPGACCLLPNLCLTGEVPPNPTCQRGLSSEGRFSATAVAAGSFAFLVGAGMLMLATAMYLRRRRLQRGYSYDGTNDSLPEEDTPLIEDRAAAARPGADSAGTGRSPAASPLRRKVRSSASRRTRARVVEISDGSDGDSAADSYDLPCPEEMPSLRPPGGVGASAL